MHNLIHGILLWYFATLERFGLLGVVVLMAMESSIFPVPSELVVPPAAYLESHTRDGQLKGDAFIFLALVILAGTLGSYLGSAITYWVARIVGRPLIVRYGKYILIPEKKLHLAEQWVARYGAGGIFFARLLPVVRHLISIPAGIVGMRFRTFSIMTITGSFIWCTVLAVFGLMMAKDMATIREGIETAGYKQAFNNLTLATVLMVGMMLALYAVVLRRHGEAPRAEEAPEQAEEAITPTVLPPP